MPYARFGDFFQALFRANFRAGKDTHARAVIADAARKLARIDTFNGENAVTRQLFGKRFFASEIRRFVVIFRHDQPADRGSFRFVVLVVDAVIADKRIRCHDALKRIGRIGNDFLIPYHRGIEHDFENAFFVCPEPVTEIFAAVFENQFSVEFSCHTVFPPHTVSRHLP